MVFTVDPMSKHVYPEHIILHIQSFYFTLNVLNCIKFCLLKKNRTKVCMINFLVLLDDYFVYKLILL